MSKIKTLLKSALENASWADVSQVYFLLTGERVSVKSPKVDPLSMKKKDLYNYLKNNNIHLEPIGSYELEDLHIIYNSEGISDTEKINKVVESISQPMSDIHQQEINMSPQPDISYVSPKRAQNLINLDKQQIQVRLNDFDSYGDEPPPKAKAKRERITVKSKCKYCSKMESLNPVLTYGAGNERTHICEKCGAKS